MSAREIGRAASYGSAGFESGAIFVGRQVEMATLVDGLGEAAAGRAWLFLLAGEPGIGKSRLADELASYAKAHEARVLWGRCWEAGGAPAYWPWVQSLRSYIRELDADTLRSQLGLGAPHVAQILPEVRRALPDLSTPPAVDPETARFRLFEATGTFLRNAAEIRPIVLVLDDLHAADTPSLLLLEFLAGELADASVVLVGAYRDTELTRDHPLSATVAELLRQRTTQRLPLTGLARDEVASFIELTGGAVPKPSLVAAVHAETEGNPLFVGEVVRLLATEGLLGTETAETAWRPAVPNSVRDVIARRLSRLSEECNRVLAVASALGREFDLDALERVSGLPRQRLLTVLDEAFGLRIVGDVPGSLGRLRFSHALVRDTLYDELPISRRVHLHRAVGEALEALYGMDVEPYLAELAHHFTQAARGGDVGKAVDYARRAGERAVRVLAYEEAVRLFRMALQGVELHEPVDPRTRCDLLLALGDAQARAGDEDAARATFLRASETARTLGAPEHLARAALGFGGRFVWARAGTDEHLVPLLEEALRGLGDEESPLRVRVMSRLAGALRDQHDRKPRDSLSREAVEIARRLNDPGALAYALSGRWAAIFWPENPEERRAIVTELVRLADQTGDRELAHEAHYIRDVGIPLELGDLATVRAELENVARLTEELHQPAQRWLLAVTRAMLALFEGRFQEAEALVEEAFTLGERAQQRDAVLSHRVQRFTLGWQRGEVEGLEEMLVRSAAEYPARPMFRCMLALLYIELERPEDARAVLEPLAADRFAALPATNEWLFSMGLLAEVAARLGDLDRAREMYELLLPYAARNASTPDYIATGSVSRPLGMLAGALARWSEAERHFEEALDKNERMGARPWVARTQHDYASMLLSRDAPGDRERAAALLGAALATARERGMVGLEAWVVALTESGGGLVAPLMQPRPTAPSVFRREGDYWSIAFEGDAFRLKHVKGLHYLARLLAEPGREFHALDLVAAERGTAAERRPREAGLETAGFGDAGEILDAQAKTAYRQRLTDLEEEMDEARAFGDEERAARAEEERALLVSEIARAVGLGGRSRKAASASERARVSVTQAIRAAIRRIAGNSPSLGGHLERTIRTGTFCSYAPDPRVPVDWRL